MTKPTHKVDAVTITVANQFFSIKKLNHHNFLNILVSF